MNTNEANLKPVEDMTFSELCNYYYETNSNPLAYRPTNAWDATRCWPRWSPATARRPYCSQ